MPEGSLPEIGRRLYEVAAVAGSQAPLLGHEADAFTTAQSQLAEVLTGADDPEAQALPAYFGLAAEKTREAASLLAELQAKVERYAGSLVMPHSAAMGEGAGMKSEGASPKRSIGDTELMRTGPKPPLAPPEASMDPRSRALRQDIRRRIYYLRKYMAGQGLPDNPEQEEALRSALQMAKNAAEQLEEGSVCGTTLENHFAAPEMPDPFTLEEKAKTFVDEIMDGVEEPDMFDLVAGVVAFNRIALDVLSKMPSLETGNKKTRLTQLGIAVDQELVQRVPFEKLGGIDEVLLQNIYDRTYAGSAPGWDTQMQESLYQAQAVVIDRINLLNLVMGENSLSSRPEIAENNYNRPFRPGEREKLNETAAATIEGVQLLKGHGITPMVISGKDIGLPWDIAVSEPIENNPGVREKGAVADFIVLPPQQDQHHLLLQRRPHPDNPKNEILETGESGSLGRFRLHDDGQISHGLLGHNVPSDITERQFAEASALTGYERLRGLLIAIAYDAVVPEDVVRQGTGGSVAAQYKRRERGPAPEPVTSLLLRRQRELNRANVSERNPRPTDWVWPTQIIGGHIKRLPEGYRARPTAEAEAREYYKSLKIPFDGLPEGMNFVGEYKRGADHEPTTFRPARFRPTSKTRGFLHKNNN